MNNGRRARPRCFTTYQWKPSGHRTRPIRSSLSSSSLLSSKQQCVSLVLTLKGDIPTFILSELGYKINYLHHKLSINPTNCALHLLPICTVCCGHCSVTKPCPTLCDPRDCSMPGFPVLHHLPEFLHWVVMLSNHLILCHPLFPLPSTFPSIKVFSIELALHIRCPKYWSSSQSQSWFLLGLTSLISVKWLSSSSSLISVRSRYLVSAWDSGMSHPLIKQVAVVTPAETMFGQVAGSSN